MPRATSWDSLPLLLSVPEVQDTLGLSKHHSYAVANSIGVRVGKRLLVSKDALRAWMNRNAGMPGEAVTANGR